MVNREAERFAYTESTALLTALDWTGLVWTGSGGTGTHQMRMGDEGAGSKFGWGGQTGCR